MITDKILKELDLTGKIRSGIEYSELNKEEKDLFCKKLDEKKMTLKTNKKTKISRLVSLDNISFPDPKILLQQDPSLYGLKTKNFSELSEEEQKIFTEIYNNWENELKDKIRLIN